MLEKPKRKHLKLVFHRYLNQLISVCLQEILRFTGLFEIIIIPAIVTLSLYTVIFVDVLGIKIDQMGGMPYKDFVIPGLLIMTVISNVFAHVTTSVYTSKRQAYVTEQLVAGMPEWIFIFGYLFGGILRGVAVAFVGFIVIFILVDYRPYSIFLSMALVVITSILFSLFAVVVALLAKRVETLSALSMYVIIPSTMFGGVYYSPDMLTGIGYRLTLADPIFHIVSAFRRACSGIYSFNMNAPFFITLTIMIILALFARTLIHRISYRAE